MDQDQFCHLDKNNRLIQDLEISNHSLLSVNSSLETTIRLQTAKLEMLMQEMHELKSKNYHVSTPYERPFTTASTYSTTDSSTCSSIETKNNDEHRFNYFVPPNQTSIPDFTDDDFFIDEDECEGVDKVFERVIGKFQYLFGFIDHALSADNDFLGNRGTCEEERFGRSLPFGRELTHEQHQRDEFLIGIDSTLDSLSRTSRDIVNSLPHYEYHTSFHRKPKTQPPARESLVDIPANPTNIIQNKPPPKIEVETKPISDTPKTTITPRIVKPSVKPSLAKAPIKAASSKVLSKKMVASPKKIESTPRPNPKKPIAKTLGKPQPKPLSASKAIKPTLSPLPVANKTKEAAPKIFSEEPSPKLVSKKSPETTPKSVPITLPITAPSMIISEEPSPKLVSKKFPETTPKSIPITLPITPPSSPPQPKPPAESKGYFSTLSGYLPSYLSRNVQIQEDEEKHAVPEGRDLKDATSLYLDDPYNI